VQAVEALVIVALAAIGSWVLVLGIIAGATRAGIVARPGGRRQHHGDIPLLGGWAPLVIVMAAIVVLAPDDRSWHGVVVGLAVVAILGGIDDWRELSPAVKLLGQIIVAAIVVSSGSAVHHFSYPLLGVIHLGGLGGATVSGAVIVLLMNACNLLDGSDGLASSVGVIAAITLGGIAWSLQRFVVADIAAAVVGAWLGFLPKNFPPAQIFLGESGASGLGLILAVIAIQGQLKTSASLALLAPILALGLPLVDSLLVVFARLRYHQPIWRGDRQHLYHRLVARGYSSRQVLKEMLGPVILGALTALASRVIPYSNGHGHFYWLGTTALALLVLATIGMSLRLGRRLALPLVDEDHLHER
jgi:UDP-GlcNAc:undecaprenyl-phosphate GlcNAc-1-phosphate transferase